MNEITNLTSLIFSENKVETLFRLEVMAEEFEREIRNLRSVPMDESDDHCAVRQKRLLELVSLYELLKEIRKQLD